MRNRSAAALHLPGRKDEAAGVCFPPHRTTIDVVFKDFSAGKRLFGGGDVTEHMSATPASNNDTLIRSTLEPDLTLD